MKRYAEAEWKGGIMDGKGAISTESGTLERTPYSFKTRFEDGKGTNPEELIAAAHAGCFSMALSLQLEQAGFKAEKIYTKATVSLEKTEKGFEIPAIHLQLRAQVPHIAQEKFQEIAKIAKENCPVSKLMKADISMDASLEH